MSAIDSIYGDMKDAAAFLAEANEISLKITMEDNLRKHLLLSAASFFEKFLTKVVSDFADSITENNSLIGSLIYNKVISRQYHSWFDWDRNNANKFFALFGPEFKDHMAKILSSEVDLSNGMADFMEIGRERNLLVHSDYASYSINKTPEEIYDQYKSAYKFVCSVCPELISCSQSIKARTQIQK